MFGKGTVVGLYHSVQHKYTSNMFMHMTLVVNNCLGYSRNVGFNLRVTHEQAKSLSCIQLLGFYANLLI